MSYEVKGKAGRLGDSTRARIDNLKGGWKVPGTPVMEEILKDDDIFVYSDSTQKIISDENSKERPKAKSSPPPLPPQARKSRSAPPPFEKKKNPYSPPGKIAVQSPDLETPESGKSTKASALVQQESLVKVSAAKSPENVVKASAAKSPENVAKASAKSPENVVKASAAKSPENVAKASAAKSPESVVKASAAKSSENVAKASAAKSPENVAKASAARSPENIAKASGAKSIDNVAKASSVKTQEKLPKSKNVGCDFVEKGESQVDVPEGIARKSGIIGDIVYVFRVFRERKIAKKQLQKIQGKLENASTERKRKLLEAARFAVGDKRNDETLVGRARDSLLHIEEERSRHAGRVVAFEEKMLSLKSYCAEQKNKRFTEKEEYKRELSAALASLDAKQSQASGLRKNVSKFRKKQSVLTKMIRKKDVELEKLAGGDGRTSVEAKLASLKAERKTYAQNEPLLCTELDELEPKISKLLATRTVLAGKIEVLDKDEDEDKLRIQEKENAIVANQIVDKRAVADKAAHQQDALIELGEALHRQNKKGKSAKVMAIQEHDMEIGALARRKMELGELREGVEWLAFLRGAFWMLSFFLLIGAAISAYFLNFYS